MGTEKPSKNKSEFDAYSKDYSHEINKAISFAGKDHDFFTMVKGRYLSEMLTQEIKSQVPLKVLDVGCGHGLIHPYLKEMTTHPLEITGIDVASDVIEIAKKDHPQNVYSDYDGKKIPYPDGSFDVTYTICVMHHVPPNEWDNFVSELKRVTKNGGLVVVFEHNPFNPLTLWIVNTCPIDKDAVLLNPSKLKNLMSHSDLKLEAVKSILFTPFKGKLFENFDQMMGWLPLGAQYYVKSRKD